MDDNEKQKIIDTYKIGMIKYKTTGRPHNYVPQFIRTTLKKRYSNELIHKIVFIGDLEDRYCDVCKKKIEYKKFSYVSNTCCNKCAHSTDNYKRKFSELSKGRPNPNKGKTYREIYGTDTPNCGFKKGDDNIAKKSLIRKKISESVRNSYSLELREKRRKQAYAPGGFVGSNTFRYKYINSKGEKFRSILELEFSELLIANNIEYVYEKRVQLFNKKVKIVDFVLDDEIFIEISGYAHKKWQDDFDKKIEWLRFTLEENKIVIIITYDNNLYKMMDNFSYCNLSSNLFVLSFSDKKNLLTKIEFSKNIVSLNKELLYVYN